ncbi:hypothetical protein OKA04_18135 [Luteolibacter flavescens]|uniref:LPS export ABC transporter periplasmic protein LptC n=1 Tax=Luteolibacter flavescens TaxID=1859460 RepID=A0ABT3FTL6_9BACT|nr:hypothetical protein [Luteolibacter flavescens]MCW1886664.1 hypothetical protein [Luteolibacter flavescens]
MSDKKTSGCVVAAIVGAAVMVAVAALIAVFLFRGAVAGKKVIAAEFEKMRVESDRVVAEAAALQPVELIRGKLPDYSTYQVGQPLTREMFIAWRTDSTATSLVQDTFREKAEGADVSWNLRAGDLRLEGDHIVGSFYIPYAIATEGGPRLQTGIESVRCEFAAGERESLLNIRREQMATIRGKLTLQHGETLLRGARQAGTEVEKE